MLNSKVNKLNKYKLIELFLNNCKYEICNKDEEYKLFFSNNPFYIVNTDKTIENVLVCKNLYKDVIKILDRLEEWNLPIGYKIIWKYLGNPNIIIKDVKNIEDIRDKNKREYRNFILFSLKELIIFRQYYAKYFLDLGLKYIGMGYVEVLSWCPIKKKCFIRIDGGSSIMDVENNMKIWREREVYKDNEITFFNFEEFIDVKDWK
jgi:hypothetical protein